jgi:hypothetical protein
MLEHKPVTIEIREDEMRRNGFVSFRYFYKDEKPGITGSMPYETLRHMHPQLPNKPEFGKMYQLK